jgi:site-specific recombinase XerD
LTWRDLQPRTAGGQVTVFGKGSKTRVGLLPNAIWRELLRFRQHADLGAPVFASRRGGGHLHPSMVERIVTKAALRGGLEGRVSLHWVRHSHAIHALERGAPIHLVGHASVATTGRYLHAWPTDCSSKYLAV